MLVRSPDGRNLMIIEVKASGEVLDNNVKEQGISYARLLRKGGIAPFVVITNGHETKIYDSVSGDLINGNCIPIDHPHIKSGFRVSVDDIAIRAEALESFISLSPDNLIKFCHHQVRYRMRFLRDCDPLSGKKYIPDLYIERPDAKKEFARLISKEDCKVIILTGHPQVGKTNFICHIVEEYLTQGTPCLFYPAIGMEKGLLESICDDFEWIMGDGNTVYQILSSKLNRILQRTGQKMVLFIDGWNETDINLARAIDRESERLSNLDICIVISMTNIAARRLLLDSAGNISYIAEAAGISSLSVSLIEISPNKLKRTWSLIYLDIFSESESKEAYDKYSQVYDVTLPINCQLVKDPLLLRIGMEVYQGKLLPASLDEPSLLEKSIHRKASRSGDLQQLPIQSLLCLLADEMFLHDAPLPLHTTMACWRMPILEIFPKGFLETAILANVHNEQGLSSIDFYYERERDFIVACWARLWTKSNFDDQQFLRSELFLAAQTHVGMDALRWFLRQPQYEFFLKASTKHFSHLINPDIQRIVLSSIGIFYLRNHQNTEWQEEHYEWIIDVIREAAKITDILVKSEVAKLLALTLNYYDNNNDMIMQIFWDNSFKKHLEVSNHLESFLANFLDVEENYSLVSEFVMHIILSTLKGLQVIFYDVEEAGKGILPMLERLTCSPSNKIRISAVRALGFVDPFAFFKDLHKKIVNNVQLALDIVNKYEEGVFTAVESMEEDYFGEEDPLCQVFK